MQPGRIHMTEDKGGGGIYIHKPAVGDLCQEAYAPTAGYIFVTYCEQAFSLNAMTSEFTGAIIWSEQNDTVRPEDGDCQLACVECCYLTGRYPTEYPPSRERLWHRGMRPPYSRLNIKLRVFPSVYILQLFFPVLVKHMRSVHAVSPLESRKTKSTQKSYHNPVSSP